MAVATGSIPVAPTTAGLPAIRCGLAVQSSGASPERVGRDVAGGRRYCVDRYPFHVFAPFLVEQRTFGGSDGERQGSALYDCSLLYDAHRRASFELIVAPITHRPPGRSGASIEVPAPTCKSLAWIAAGTGFALDELNRFAWPGYDLRPIRVKLADTTRDAAARIFQRLREGILARQSGTGWTDHFPR